jgi:CRP/FNR family transcriptional regulator, cyclic AMP receptor protein
VRVLEVDPDLGRTLSQDDLHEAQARVSAPTVVLEPGRWDQRALFAEAPAVVGMLVLEGLVARDVVVDGRSCRQLLGSGDALLEGAAHPVTSLLHTHIEWIVLERTRVALLGEAWVRATGRWPALNAELLLRAGEQAARLAVYQAIVHLPNVEDRVRSLFLLLADRWGRVTGDGIVIPVTLTHEALGLLVGAKRPTVTLALQELERQDLLSRRRDGTWVLSAHSLAQAAGAHPADATPTSRRRHHGPEPLGPPEDDHEALLERVRVLERDLATVLQRASGEPSR